MNKAKAYAGVCVVAGVVLLSALAGERGAVLSSGVIGDLSAGLFAASAAFALVANRERRDPTLLLVGVGAAAVTIHSTLAALLIFSLDGNVTDAWIRLISFTPIAGMLALLGNLVAVVPWRDRRGRPPLQPRRVVGATVGALVAFDLLVILSGAGPIDVYAGTLQSLGVLGILATGALMAGGAMATVRSLQWGGRFGWVASAGFALAFAGVSALLSSVVDGDRALQIVGIWAGVAPGLAAASLAVFVMASLKLETSRLRRVTDRAAEVMEGRAEIAATIAHDVRGPVGTIKGLATTTRKSYDKLGDTQRLEFIGMIEEESGRLLRLVDQVAVGLKVDAGSLDLVPRAQDVAPLVRQAVEDLGVAERPIDVDAPPDVHAAVDTRWFVEAVRQGIDNAVHFSPSDQPVTITLRKAHDDGALVTIADRGPGIPPEQRDAVFERFSRWRPAGYEDRQGAGLGLFICRGIARAHGGEASLDANPGGGTMLRIRFPREATG